MTYATKPPVKPSWADSGDKITPTDLEIQAGWPLTSTPPSRQRFNWFFNLAHNGLNYFLQRGIPQWDSGQAYPVGAKVIASDGLTYTSLTENTNQDPTTNADDWDQWALSLTALSNLFTKIADLASTAVGKGASLVGFKQLGTGAVARTLNDKGQECISVFDFMTAAQIADVKSGQRNLDHTAAVSAAITYANTLTGSQSAVLNFPAGTYSITPGGLPAIVCDIYGPRAILWSRSSAAANLIQLGFSPVTNNNIQHIKLFGLTGYNWDYDTTAGNFVGSTSGSSTVLTIESTTVAPQVGQIIAPGCTISSFGTYNGTSGTINLSIAQNIPSSTHLASVSRYGYAFGYVGTAGQIIGSHIVDIGYIQGFNIGIHADLSAGFHVGTSIFNINTLWFCSTGIHSISQNLQFENNIFNITYGTGFNTAVYSNSIGTEHNVQNVYNFGALELHRYWASVAFSSNGANTNQNTFNVTSLSYNTMTVAGYIVVGDGAAWGNIYNLPVFDTVANGFNITCGADIIRCQGFGNIDVSSPTRSLIYMASGTLPGYTGLRDGDRVIINNPAAGSPASYVRSGGNWVTETYAELAGTVTLTGTGFSGTAPAVSAKYKLINGRVFIYIPSVSGTSNATTFTLTGLPAALRPASAHNALPMQGGDNGATTLGSFSVDNTGVITLGKGMLGGAWTASGTKVLYTNDFSWSLD